MNRVLIVNDGKAWFVRRVRVIEHDLEADEKVYRCDKHLGGPFKTPEEAIASLPLKPKRLNPLQKSILRFIRGDNKVPAIFESIYAEVSGDVFTRYAVRLEIGKLHRMKRIRYVHAGPYKPSGWLPVEKKT